MNFALTVRPRPGPRRCGQAVEAKLHYLRASTKAPTNVDRTVTEDLDVAVPSPDGVVVVAEGPTRAPYESYLLARVGASVSDVAVLSGPDDVEDHTPPSDGWAVLGPGVPLATSALRAMTTTGAKQFFLADAAPPCAPSPKPNPTPTCQSGQYRSRLQADIGAGSLTMSAHVTSTGASCVLEASATGRFVYADGQPDGPPVATAVNWILPATVMWQAGSDCFDRTETFTATIGSVSVADTEPGGDCSTAPAGNALSTSHVLSRAWVSGGA